MSSSGDVASHAINLEVPINGSTTAADLGAASLGQVFIVTPGLTDMVVRAQTSFTVDKE
jgi:hypothetical protein